MSELPKGWAEASIGDVVAPFQIFDPKKNPDSEFRYIDIGSIDNSRQVINDVKVFLGKNAPSRARRVVHSGDVLFSTVRTYLKNIALVPDDLDGSLTSTGIAVLRPSGAVDGKYLFRWVCSEPFVAAMSKAQDGTMYPAVTDKDVYGGSIAVPPLEEQRLIVAKLDSFFERTRRAREELSHIPRLIENYKKAILAAAFRGDLTKDWRERGGLPSPEEVALGDVADSFSYGSSSKSSPTGKIPVLRMGNIQNMALDWRDLVYTSNDQEIEKYSLITGDVLFNRTNSPELVGKTALYQGERPAIYAGYLIRIRCGNKLLSKYLNYCLNSPMGRLYCWNVKTDGVSQSNINAKKLAAFRFLLPVIEEQEEIVCRIEKALDWLNIVYKEQEQATHLLNRLDQANLTKAFRGELVPQNPNDEPASVLLDRIRLDRQVHQKAKLSRKR